MQTPFGLLSELDLKKPRTILEILSFDKHQIAEGMIVESIFEQVIDKIPEEIGAQKVSVLDVETYITREADFKTVNAFVWERSRKSGLGRYLRALGRKFNVYLVRFDDNKRVFRVCSIKDGARCGGWLDIEEFMLALGKIKLHEYEVDESVRCEERQLSAFWGYLQGVHGGELAAQVALPRLLVNWGIYPWYKFVWNIDRVLLVGDQVWVLEVKHKFPYGKKGGLKFGLNDGEAYVLRDVVDCGIKAIHLVIVKPHWDVDVSSLNLLSEFKVKERALVVGMLVDGRYIRSILARQSETSGGKTVISGKGRVKFKPLRVGEFSVIGSLAEPNLGAEVLSGYFRGCVGEVCTEDKLIALQMS